MPLSKPRRAPPRRSPGLRPRHAKKTLEEALITPQDQQERSVLSHEEKHQLILAHAARHAAHGQGWGIGYSIAILASCLVVVSGWWITLDTNMRRSINPSSDQTWESMSSELSKIEQVWEEAKDTGEARVGTLLQRLQEAQNEVRAAEGLPPENTVPFELR
jgi:hypothetical protein